MTYWKVDALIEYIIECNYASETMKNWNWTSGHYACAAQVMLVESCSAGSLVRKRKTFKALSRLFA